ncbi:MAG: cyclic nucleotide-binding domain-containing protein [Pseudomonadota bacterium]
MNVLSPAASRVDLQGLIDAIAQASADDSMTNPLTPAQWDVVASYLLPCIIPTGHVLFTQGTTDRTLYFVESGSLSVHFQDEKERLRLAIVGPGSVLGEGAFFSHRARSATVQASGPCKLWSLTAIRFTELTNRQPAIALGLAMAAGSVLAKRLGNRRRRVAAT